MRGSPPNPAHLCWNRAGKAHCSATCSSQVSGKTLWQEQRRLAALSGITGQSSRTQRTPQMMGESWGGPLEVIPLCTGCSQEPAPRSHSGGLGWTARLTLTHEWQRRREHRPTRGSGCAVHRKTEKTAHVQQSCESCPDKDGTPWKYLKVKRVTGQAATWKRR